MTEQDTADLKEAMANLKRLGRGAKHKDQDDAQRRYDAAIESLEKNVCASAYDVKGSWFSFENNEEILQALRIAAGLLEQK